MAVSEVKELQKKAHAVWKGRISIFNKMTAAPCSNVFHSKDEESVSPSSQVLLPHTREAEFDLRYL